MDVNSLAIYGRTRDLGKEMTDSGKSASNVILKPEIPTALFTPFFGMLPLEPLHHLLRLFTSIIFIDL
jgi:hypothetical protein